MPRSNDYDVIVIGGGPSGATAARYLAEAGLSVALIERDLSHEKPCGGGIFLRAFDEFGISYDLIKKYVDSIEIVSPDAEKVSVDISDFPLGVVHRQEFDRTLRDMADKAGAAIIEGRMHDITPGSERVVVHIHTDTKNLELSGDHLIAADGVNSHTRKLLLNEHPSRILTYYANIEDAHTDACQFWFGSDIAPRHYAWIFPHHNGINIGLASDSKDRIGEYYANFYAKADISDMLPKPKGYYIPYWKPMKLYADRVFYVGDSASLVLPFTYEGIYYAMRSGQLAAEAIIDGKPELYPQEWDRLFLKKFRFLRLLQSIFVRNDWLTRKMTDLYKNQRFQRSVIGYWSGAREPEGVVKTLYKVIKGLFFYR